MIRLVDSTDGLLTDFRFQQRQTAVADFHIGGDGDGVFTAVRAGQRPVQIPVAGHQRLFHNTPFLGSDANTGKVNGKLLTKIAFAGILEFDVELVFHASVFGDPLENGRLKLIIPTGYGLTVGCVDPFPGLIARGAIEESTAFRAGEIRIAAEGNAVPENIGITVFRQGEALHAEDNLGTVTVCDGLHRRNGDALIGGAEHLAGGYLLLLVLQHHGQAAFLCLLLDLLGRVVGRLGAS